MANEVRGEELGTLKGKVVSGGKPVTTGRVEVPLGKSKVHAFPDAKGEFSLKLAPGTFDVTASDIGRLEVKQSVTLAAGKTESLTLDMGAASRVDFAIQDDQGRSTPCKAMFEGLDGTPNPDLGPVMRAMGARISITARRASSACNCLRGSIASASCAGANTQVWKKLLV